MIRYDPPSGSRMSSLVGGGAGAFALGALVVVAGGGAAVADIWFSPTMSVAM